MGSANSSAFLHGTADIESATQVCPLKQKTVALYPVRWAISQEEAPLPANFRAPGVALEKTHYCLRTLKAGWVYMYSELYGTLHEYRVDESGVISEVTPGVNSVLLPDADAESALPCIHHPEVGTVYLKFAQHRWTVRLQELARIDAQVRSDYMQAFVLDGLVAQGEAINIGAIETVNQFVEEYRAAKTDFDWSLTDLTNGLTEQDLQGQSKKATEFSYSVALNDEVGITSELGQLHALYVNLITNYAEENVYPYTTAKLADALIEHEVSKKTDAEDQADVRRDLQARIRVADKEAFVTEYHQQIEAYDRERGRVFDDWQRWVNSDLLARKIEFNDICMAEGFEAVEQELADILDGYVSAESGREDANKWLSSEDGEAGAIGDTLKAVLFLVAANHKITEKLKDLPGFDYGSLKIVDRMYDLPAYVEVTMATDTLFLEFATPAAQMGEWAKSPQTRPQWKKWIKDVSHRYQIPVHERSMSLDTATDLLLKAHQDALAESSGYALSGATLSPVAAGMMEASIRNRLRANLIDTFHLTPDFKDNPFGWLHTRLDPVVESIKENRGKFIGAVTFFQAINLANLFLGIKETQNDIVLGHRSALDRWLPFMESLTNVAEGVINGSALIAKSEHVKALKTNLSGANGSRVLVALNASKGLRVVGVAMKFIAKGVVKTVAIAGPLLTMWLELRTINRSSETGHHASVVLASMQFGLSVSLLALPGLAAIGVFSLGVGLAIGVALVAVSIAIGIVQAYIARSQIEDFLSLSFWGNAPTLRYWDEQPRLPNGELLAESQTVVSQGEVVEVKRYFEAELEAFYYMLFSPIVRITDYMPKHGAITHQGEYRVLSELTEFVLFFPGFSEVSCVVSVRIFEVNNNWVFDDKWNEITDLFQRRVKASFPVSGAMYRFAHFNHDNWEQLEVLVEYVKDGRKVTGENGLRFILNGNDVKELGVNERLTFEL